MAVKRRKPLPAEDGSDELGYEPTSERVSDSERFAWIVLLFLSLAFRLYDLGSRPFHHDESIHASFSNQLAWDGTYKYDPVYHGPVQYVMVATSFRIGHALRVPSLTKAPWNWDPVLDDRRPELLGRADFFARLPAALGGVLLVAMAWLLRARFGKVPAFAAGALLALSPLFLYYTRFCREDVWSLLGTCGALLYFDAWWREKKLKHLVYTALLGAVAFAAKENFYVFLALLVPSVALWAFEPGKHEGDPFDSWNRLHKLLKVLREHQVALAGALLLFFVASELLYTALLVHPESGNPAFTAISYWYGQHKIERVGGPKTYYLPRLALYEFATLGAALLWILRLFPFGRVAKAVSDGFATESGQPLKEVFVEGWSRLSGVERFLLGLGVSSILMYGYLGEKTPWLMVHQLFPFIPLAALMWARLEDVPEGPEGLMLRTGTATIGFASFVTALSLSFWFPSLSTNQKQAESAIYVQTSPDLLKYVAETRAAARAGADLAAFVEGEAGWPLSWYFRGGMPVQWQMLGPGDPRRPPLAFIDPGKKDDAMAFLGPGYEATEIPLRSWWVPDRNPSVLELLKYLATREPWPMKNGDPAIGAQRIVVLRRTKEAAAKAAAGAIPGAEFIPVPQVPPEQQPPQQQPPEQQPAEQPQPQQAQPQPQTPQQ